MSNSTQVMLQDVQFKLSGNISCEVSADSPSFSTAIVSRHLMVVGQYITTNHLVRSWSYVDTTLFYLNEVYYIA